MQQLAGGLFKILVEQSNDITLICDKHFVIKYISGPVEKLLGLKGEEALGNNLFSFADLQKKESFVKFVKNSGPESTLTKVHMFLWKGRKLFFDITISNWLANDKVKGLVLRLHDITDQKVAEEKLQKAKNELDHFIYKTSHDLRAPLLSSIGLVKLAERDADRDKYDYLGMIRNSLEKLDGFIEDINSFHRNDSHSVKCEPVDIKGLIQGELNNIDYRYVKKRIEIKHQITQFSKLYSDNARLKSIVTNVLSNAIKYHDELKENPLVQINVRVTPEECVIEVEDNGIGIRQKYLSSIFNIFYRADDNAKGSGLGLYIVKDTVDKLDGRIEVQSEYGKGSTFTIAIPNFLDCMIDKIGL